ncbi:hypothetical protein GH714_014954 [Hevea brasiliensis]|uniref:Uncharacterized protein n=1 Tax=Hevea brasiliensis TaxID=3981 RepID=A0A6A6K4P4_HEVBR|nr:hypothetical protein GH714_014954 [Hevea brasiliensis]
MSLRETVVSAIPKSPIGNAHPIEFPEQPQQELPGENCKEETESLDSEWVISINKNLEQARQDDAAGSWAKLCIYRVPHYLREGDDKAYVPQLVSLASYHHGRTAYAKWIAISGVLYTMYSSVLIRT